jgi:hypothetical protein
MAGVTCVSPSVFRVDHWGLIVHACQWTLLSDQRSTFILASVPGCHYIMSEQTYVYCHDITLFRPSHIILNSAIRTFHVLRIAVQLLSRLSVSDVAAAWEASAVFDVLVFGLTLMRTLNMRKVHNIAISFTGEGLLDMILRDGK